MTTASKIAASFVGLILVAILLLVFVFAPDPPPKSRPDLSNYNLFRFPPIEYQVVAGNNEIYFGLVAGVSNYPVIQEGQILTYKKIPFDEIQIGDFILFQPPHGTEHHAGGIVHQVVQIRADGIRTQGANRKTNRFPDDYRILPHMYGGTVIAVDGKPFGRFTDGQ